jgi:hypothetical protein
MKQPFPFALLVVALAGCATPTTGIIPLGQGAYKVSHQGAGAWVSTDSLKTAAMIEATRYCDSRERSFKLINVKEIPAGPFGRWPEAEVTFSCIPPL